jgi:hypothetical protein
MSSGGVSTDPSTEIPEVGKIDMKLEVVQRSGWQRVAAPEIKTRLPGREWED